jgi:hypothetical protein
MTTAVPKTAALAEFTTYDVPFPFFREEKAHGFDTGWRIGVRDRGTDHASADAIGVLVVTTLAIVSPGGKYGRRVFYHQSWRDPDGAAFGAPGLRCDTITSVEKKLAGFKGHFRLCHVTKTMPLARPASPAGQLRLVGPTV